MFVEWNIVQLVKKEFEGVKQLELGELADPFHRAPGIVCGRTENIFSEFEKVLVAAKRQKLRVQDFLYQTEQVPSPLNVAVLGSWDNWQIPKKLAYDAFSKSWHVTLRLLPGKYLFKFNVDDRWETI